MRRWVAIQSLLIVMTVSCSGRENTVDQSKMAAILKDMIEINASKLAEDSLAVSRMAVLKKHETTEAEVRDWINQLSKDATLSQALAKELGSVLQKNRTPAPPTYRDATQ